MVARATVTCEAGSFSWVGQELVTQAGAGFVHFPQSFLKIAEGMCWDRRHLSGFLRRALWRKWDWHVQSK